ncbi:hypothetical protein [Stenotrophomonas phage StenR_269]|nr:hypothetical protein [Stenotrophomonas phage StenR_269]
MIFTKAQWAINQRQSEEATLSSFEAIRNNFMRGTVGKAIRPWFVVDFTKILPTEATMFGFEIETGFGTVAAQQETMQWLWDNTDYVTADMEGCGERPTEITFPPLTLAELDEDNQLKQWLAYNAALPVSRQAKFNTVTTRTPRGGVVGTHVNISTAAYRQAIPVVRAEVANTLARFFGNLDADRRLHLYGRQPYTEGVAQRRGGNGDAADRIEFKMFHSTTHIEQFNNYCKVAKRLAEIIDSLVANPQQQLNVAATFDYLTIDLDGRSVIAADNSAQYPEAWRNGYQNMRTQVAA